MTEPSSVVEIIPAYLCDNGGVPRHSMSVRLGWSTLAPLQINVLLQGPKNDVTWRIARTMLDSALISTDPVGDGDIIIRRIKGNTCVTMFEFNSTHGSANVATCTKPLRKFLDATCEMIAPYSFAEAVAIDDALCSMLAQVIR